MKTLTIDKQPTAAELFRVELECTRVEVMDVVHMSEDQLNEMFFETGMTFLKEIGCDDFMQTQFGRTPQFWGMWKEAWYDADREFLKHFYYYGYDTAHAYEWYRWFHSPVLAVKQKNINAAYHSLIKILAVKR